MSFQFNVITTEGLGLIAEATAANDLIIDRVIGDQSAYTEDQLKEFSEGDYHPAVGGDCVSSSTTNNGGVDIARLIMEFTQPAQTIALHTVVVIAHTRANSTTRTLCAVSDPTRILNVVGNAGSSVKQKTQFAFNIQVSRGTVVRSATNPADYMNVSETERFVSTHKAGDASSGDAQLIRGTKRFADTTEFYENIIVGDTMMCEHWMSEDHATPIHIGSEGSYRGEETLTIHTETYVEHDILPVHDEYVNLGRECDAFATVHTGHVYIDSQCDEAENDWLTAGELYYETQSDEGDDQCIILRGRHWGTACSSYPTGVIIMNSTGDGKLKIDQHSRAYLDCQWLEAAIRDGRVLTDQTTYGADGNNIVIRTENYDDSRQADNETLDGYQTWPVFDEDTGSGNILLEATLKGASATSSFNRGNIKLHAGRSIYLDAEMDVKLSASSSLYLGGPQGFMIESMQDSSIYCGRSRLDMTTGQLVMNTTRTTIAATGDVTVNAPQSNIVLNASKTSCQHDLEVLGKLILGSDSSFELPPKAQYNLMCLIHNAELTSTSSGRYVILYVFYRLMSTNDPTVRYQDTPFSPTNRGGIAFYNGMQHQVSMGNYALIYLGTSLSAYGGTSENERFNVIHTEIDFRPNIYSELVPNVKSKDTPSLTCNSFANCVNAGCKALMVLAKTI